MGNRNEKGENVVRIATLWELSWNTPIKELDLWKYPLKDFGVDKFYATPISGIDSKFVEERQSLAEILEENKDFTAVFCDERAETTLQEFKHPEKALYVFGRTNYSPFLDMKREDDLELKVETSHKKGGLLWGHQAASVILYHRLWQ